MRSDARVWLSRCATPASEVARAKADGILDPLQDVLGKGRRGPRPGKGIPGGGWLDRGDQRRVLARVKSGTGGSGKVADIGSLRGAGTIVQRQHRRGATEKRVSGVSRARHRP